MSSFIPYDDARSLLLAANLVPASNIEFANEPFTQPQGSNWLSFDAYSHNIEMMDIGAGHWAERGTVVIYVCGTAALAKAVCNVYRGLPPRNPYYENASIGSGGTSDGETYFILPVTISFVFED